MSWIKEHRYFTVPDGRICHLVLPGAFHCTVRGPAVRVYFKRRNKSCCHVGETNESYE
jgi:hypothetical protein